MNRKSVTRGSIVLAAMMAAVAPAQAQFTMKLSSPTIKREVAFWQ